MRESPRGVLVVGGIVLAVALAGGCGSHRAARRGSHRSGVIYLAATKDGATSVYRVNPDGSGLDRLRGLPRVDMEPGSFGVAPAGNVLAVVSDERTYFAAPDGSHARPENVRFGAPSTWSPDGRFIASSSATGDEALVVAGSDGKFVREIPIGAEGEPAWSPDRDRLAVSEDDATGATGPNGIYTVAPDGTGQKLLFPARLFHGEVPVDLWWSPDGNRLAFATATANSAGHLYVGDLRNGRVWRLTRHTEENPMLAWSPDGSRIAFSAARGGGPSKVYVVRPDGTAEHVVSRATGGESASAPQWSPGGTRLAYIRNRVAGESDPRGDVYLVRAEGSGTRPLLARDLGEVSSVFWTSLPALPKTRSAAPARTVPVEPLYTLRTSGAGELAANATTAAVEEATPDIPDGENCGRVVVWTPGSGREVRGGSDCGPGDVLDSLVLIGDAVVWRFSEWDRSPVADCLLLWRPLMASAPGQAPYGDCTDWPRTWLARRHIAWIRRPAGTVSQIAASGSTVLYNTAVASCYDPAVVVRSIEQDSTQPRSCRGGIEARARSARLLRLDDDHLTPLPGAPPLLVLDAFDGHLVAGRLDEHHVVVFRPGGRVVARRSFTDTVTAIRIAGSHVAIEAGDSLTVVDLVSRRDRQFPLSDAAGAPALRSFDGRLAAYTSGTEIHVVRLGDGRDRILRIPPAVQPVDAQLVPTGLFYSYNVRHDAEPGRVSLLPRAGLTRVFGT